MPPAPRRMEEGEIDKPADLSGNIYSKEETEAQNLCSHRSGNALQVPAQIDPDSHFSDRR